MVPSLRVPRPKSKGHDRLVVEDHALSEAWRDRCFGSSWPRTKKRAGVNRLKVRSSGFCNLLIADDGSDDFSGGLLNQIQRARKRFGVASVKLDVVACRGSGHKTDGLRNDERNGFGFRLANGLRRAGAAVALVQHFVSEFVCENRKLFGRRQAREKLDASAVRAAMCSAE